MKPSFLKNALLAAVAAPLIALTVAPTSAFAASPFKEVKDGKDYPLLSRFQGATLIRSGVINFDKVDVKLADGKVETMEGKVYNYFYLGPKERSELEVYRSYKKTLEQKGFKLLVACEDVDQCHSANYDTHARKWTDDSRSFAQGRHYMNNLGGSKAFRFLMARLARPTGDITAIITIRGGYMTGEGFGADYFVQVVEAGAMDQNLMVKAEALGKSLNSDGKIALYGIRFDTAKADIKPESKPQLEEMAKTLTQNPALKVYIVGHTDNQGALEVNAALSQKRADAIVAALVKDYKIAAGRLAAKGVASYAPVASNGSEQGREQNRRVEMVVQ